MHSSPNAQDYKIDSYSDSKLEVFGLSRMLRNQKYFRLSKEPGVAMEEGTYAINSVANPENIMKSEKEILTLTGKDSVNSDSRFELVEVSSKRYKRSPGILRQGIRCRKDPVHPEQKCGRIPTIAMHRSGNSLAGMAPHYIRSEVWTYLTLNDDGSGSFAKPWVKSDA